MERNSWTLMLGKKEQCATLGCVRGKLYRGGRCIECHRAKQRTYQAQKRINRKARKLANAQKENVQIL